MRDPSVHWRRVAADTVDVRKLRRVSSFFETAEIWRPSTASIHSHFGVARARDLRLLLPMCPAACICYIDPWLRSLQGSLPPQPNRHGVTSVSGYRTGRLQQFLRLDGGVSREVEGL